MVVSDKRVSSSLIDKRNKVPSYFPNIFKVLNIVGLRYFNFLFLI